MPGMSHSNTKTLMEIMKKKRVLLEDEASDWLQIWMAASSLILKNNKALKKIFVFSQTGWFPQIWSPIPGADMYLVISLISDCW